jgi:hypothetical protein
LENDLSYTGLQLGDEVLIVDPIYFGLFRSVSMRLLQLIWYRLPGIWFVVLVLLLLPGLGMAQGAETVVVQLDPVGGSGVSGTATLSAAGEGTNVVLDIGGMAPGTAARGTMQAGTCDMPSASFAALPDLEANATGRATATGSVLFRGTDDVALETMADGEHIIAIQTDQVVACGVIPKLASASSPPSSLPVTGRAVSLVAAVSVGLLGLCALSGGLFLRRRSLARPKI